MLHLKLTLAQCQMLSDALSQYVENANDPSECTVQEEATLILADHLLDTVDLAIVSMTTEPEPDYDDMMEQRAERRAENWEY
jgi:hypothetical protein